MEIGDVYTTKVGLFAHKFNEYSGLLGMNALLHPGSQVFYDQTISGKHIFALMHPDNDKYVMIPEEFMEEQMVSENANIYKENKEC